VKPLGNWHGHSTDDPRITEPLASELNLSQIITALPNLTKQDLKALQVAIDRELVINLPIDTDLFYMVFDVASEKPMSVSKFSNSENGAIWRKNQPIFNDFITTHILHGGAVHRVIMNAIKKFLINLIVEDIKTHWIHRGDGTSYLLPLTLKTICQQLGNIEIVFERSFPTYIRNKAGNLILAQLGART